jgi:hypothetical protein
MSNPLWSSPQGLKKLLVTFDGSQASFDKLPDDIRTNIKKLPVKRHQEGARDARVVRRVLLGIALILLILQRQHDLASMMLLLGCYEFAYGNAAKVRAKLEDAQEEARYIVWVNDYVKSHYPEFRPSNSEFSVFSVSANGDA